MHPIKSIALRTLLVLLAWPAAAQALKVGTISASRSGQGTLLKVSTEGEAAPKVSVVDGNKILIQVPGGQRKAMKDLKISNAGIVKGIRFGSAGGALRIVADLKGSGTASLGAVSATGFEVEVAPASGGARADAAAEPKAEAALEDESSLNPASAGYTYRVVDLALGGDDERAELVVSSDGPASYKSSLKEDGKLLSISFRNSSLAWSGDSARLADASVAGVAVRQLSEGGESVVKVDVRLREKLAYNLRRDQNQLVIHVARPEAAAAAPRAGDLDTLVSLDVEDADVVSVLKALCQQVGFEYQFTSTIQGLAPPANQVTIRVRQRPFEEVLRTLLSQVQSTYVQQGNVLYIGSTAEIASRTATLPTVARTYEPKYLTPVQLAKLLAVRYKNDPDLGIITKTIVVDPNNSARFMVTGTAFEVSKAMAALTRYDVPEPGDQAASDESGGGSNVPRTQIFKLQYLDPAANSGLISGSIAQLYTDSGETVPDVLIDANTRSLVVTTRMKYLRKIEKLLARIDVKPKQVNIEGKIVEMNQGMSRQLGIDWSAVQQTASPNAAMVFDTGLNASFVSQLTYATVQNGFNINAKIQNAVSENKADLVSAPNITTSDNQTAVITTSDTQVSVNSTAVTSNGVTTITQEFRQVEIPLRLSVKPKISVADRRVLMDVIFTLKTISGSPPVAGAPSPTSDQNAATSVNVASGDTAVIGGLVRQNNIEVESKVPVLGDIPLLGLLFKFNTVDKTKKEVIIFITPTIVED